MCEKTVNLPSNQENMYENNIPLTSCNPSRSKNHYPYFITEKTKAPRGLTPSRNWQSWAVSADSLVTQSALTPPRWPIRVSVSSLGPIWPSPWASLIRLGFLVGTVGITKSHHTELLWEVEEVMHIKRLEQCWHWQTSKRLIHSFSKYAMNSSSACSRRWKFPSGPKRPALKELRF